jgi:quercetin dioxygenase-like cupin family protein
MNPYQEIRQGEITIRTFKKDVQDDELVWHRDKEDREVRVVKGNGWQFQREDHLPILLREGDVIQIKKEEWHRIIKGRTDLIIEIKDENYKKKN